MLETPNIPAGAKNGTMANYGSDKNLWVEFSLEPVHNEFQSDEQGHPVYDDVEFVTILTPGNNKSTFKTRVTAEYIDRFPSQYQAFKSQNEQVNEGLPLTEWPVLTKAQALNMKGMKIFTVEQLANLPDNAIDALPLGGRGLRDKAISYLARAIDASEITKIHSELAKLRADNAALKEQILSNANAANSADKPKTLKLKEN